MKSPCKDCQARSPGCHATCEAYLAYRAERDMIAKARAQERTFDFYLHDHHKAAEHAKFNMQRDRVK